MTRPTSPQDDRGAPEAPGAVSGGLWLSRQDVAALLRCHVNHVDRLRAELASARQQLRAQRRVIADLQAEVARRTVTHRRIVDGGVGGRRERRELERAA